MTAATCKVNLKQIQRILIGKQAAATFTVATENPNAATTWTDRLGLSTDDKYVVTPFIEGDAQIAPGDAITEGGNDNTTLNGVEDVLGTGPSAFSGVFKGLDPAQEKILKEYMCYDLKVWFINQDGSIIGSDFSPFDGTVCDGFTVQSFFIGDRGNTGFATKDRNAISFAMPQGWSENLKVITPEAGFNPLTDL